MIIIFQMSVIKEGTLKYQDDVWKEVSAQIEGNELIIKKKDKVITKIDLSEAASAKTDGE